MKRISFLILALTLLAQAAVARKVVFHMEDYGLSPSEFDCTPLLTKFFAEQKSKFTPDDRVVMKFRRGTYKFRPEEAPQQEYYVSNHDQLPLRKIIFDLSGWHNLTIDGGGSEFVFSGTVIPFALNYCHNVLLKGFSIDFEDPKMVPLTIVESDSVRGITFSVPEWVRTSISDKGYLLTKGRDWEGHPIAGMAFEPDTRHLVYRAGEFGINTDGVQKISEGVFHAPNWKNKMLKAGMIIAARDWNRPTPAVFLNECRDTKVRDVRVYYAFGMGLLAQRCENITLKGFSVCSRDEKHSGRDLPESRLYTTHADATHFSQCRGRIDVSGGLFEGMMDDAINVHGVYLKVKRRVDDHTLLCSFEHEQAWGFNWGNTGDSVRFINSQTMDAYTPNRIASIRPYDRRELKGMRVFKIEFEDPLPLSIAPSDRDKGGVGIENLSWCPEVSFCHNTVRNNRARGALFSSPRHTVCDRNVFDHVSGTAILLCGDCNGWYESGSCRDLVISRNRFINCLTNYFQFTNAVISIYPEIPDLESQEGYFHSNVRILNNEFVYFDKPLLYAKSVDGLVFRGNKIRHSDEFAPFHWNAEPFLLQRVRNADIER